MHRNFITGLVVTGSVFIASAAYAECTGTNGRGWASGKGSGQFEMSTADKQCRISFPGFVNDTTNTRIPATEVTLRQAPKNGKLAIVAGQGLIYTPNPGFTGKDKFCSVNTSPEVKGKKLSGCVTITVR
ncbi:Ig-like domain-containing protein [Gemmobacter serpentinus]|uniref:Ig-like domain-containing protein n=1 Tax=Gemmobacter serpentinus TaxID=2652247 RepID=UPI00124C4E3F|nr:Ig-like domain-containing protein [Gemmobacter serpentinus]